MKRTFLYPQHQQLNAKFTEFGGWEMPVQYTSIIEEHNAVRTSAGIFDTSHMGTFIISGGQAGKFLDYVTISDMSNLPLHKARYSMLLNENGGIIDDIIVYRFENYYMMVVNAGNLDKDFDWLNKHIIDGVDIKNISSEICMIALQGPKAPEILSKITSYNVSAMKYFTAADVTFAGEFTALHPVFAKVARTGYTGEDGFEILVSSNCASVIWNKFIELGAKPCGLGCRDTLRLEACMPLHGHEIAEDITPIDAGFTKTVCWNKDFIGKSAIEKSKDAPKYKSIALICKSGIARNGDEVYIDNHKAGYVTSGTFSPTFKKAIAMALVRSNEDITLPVQIQIHNKMRDAQIVEKPFYKRSK